MSESYGSVGDPEASNGSSNSSEHTSLVRTPVQHLRTIADYKSMAKGLTDIALLSANVNQLRQLFHIGLKEYFLLKNLQLAIF